MTEEAVTTLRFLEGAADLEDLEAEITSALAELGDSTSDLARSALMAGLNPGDLQSAGVSVRKEGDGFGPVVLLIAISVPVTSHIIDKLWDDIIWPRVKDRLGADALGEREE